MSMISKNWVVKIFHSDQPFTIKNPANLNNIFSFNFSFGSVLQGHDFSFGSALRDTKSKT